MFYLVLTFFLLSHDPEIVRFLIDTMTASYICIPKSQCCLKLQLSPWDTILLSDVFDLQKLGRIEPK